MTFTVRYQYQTKGRRNDMVINKTIIKELEYTYRRLFPDDLKRYLLVTYAEEPFPYEYSEQDLYTNIRKDIRQYEAGRLDVKVKSPSERWQEERSYLQDLYIEKFREARELEEYAAELEQILSEHGLESSRMAKHRIEDEANPDLNF
jgi:hypothetical protein